MWDQHLWGLSIVRVLLKDTSEDGLLLIKTFEKFVSNLDQYVHYLTASFYYKFRFLIRKENMR